MNDLLPGAETALPDEDQANAAPRVDDGLTKTIRAMVTELAEHYKGADPGSISKATKALKPISANAKAWGSREYASAAVKAYRDGLTGPSRQRPRKSAGSAGPDRGPRSTGPEATDRTAPRDVAASGPEPVQTADAAPVRSEPATVRTARTGGGSDRFESVVLVLILLVVAIAAGAASFTHVKEWTIANSPTGTGEWFGWANAVISELIPLAALLTIRRRRRLRQPIGYPMFLLFCGVALSLAAQLAVAKPGLSGWLLSAVPALAFMGLSKLVLATAPTPDRTTDVV